MTCIASWRIRAKLSRRENVAMILYHMNVVSICFRTSNPCNFLSYAQGSSSKCRYIIDILRLRSTSLLNENKAQYRIQVDQTSELHQGDDLYCVFWYRNKFDRDGQATTSRNFERRVGCLSDKSNYRATIASAQWHMQVKQQ
jgi:hypothetical protein